MSVANYFLTNLTREHLLELNNMTLLSSPALQQVETALQVTPGSFANKNYRSVFDIARTSRKQFIADNMSWLGLRGGKAWDLAVGQAQHIRRLFRENQLTQQIRLGLPQRLSGQRAVSSASSDNIQGLVQDGPTWQNQFAENWQNYCQPGATEAADSPVSYLTWLYQQALRFEEAIQAGSTADQVITLAERRPDLATLTVDNDAVNQVVPALQLVNEILEEGIATVLPADQSVDETLAETRYPTLLPYHFPHDQVELALLNAGVPLEEIIGQTSTDWPWFLNDSWRGKRSNNSTELASGLAPEQQTLVSEPDNSDVVDMTSFYKANLGLATADYTPFIDLNTFTYQLGMTVPQVEELVAGNGEGSSSVVISPNITSANNVYQSVNSYDYGASFINKNSANSLDLISSSIDYVLSGEPSFICDAIKRSAVSLKSSENQYITIYDDFTTVGNNKSNFSMGFWVNINSTPSGDVMISGNTKISNGDRSKDFGFSILGMSGKFDLNVTDEKGNYKNAQIAYAYNEWNYFIFSVDWQSNQLIICKRTSGIDKDVKSATIDLSSLTEGLPAVNKWFFNNDSGEDYYQRFDRSATIDIQEVAVWDLALTIDEMSAISASTLPAGGRTDMLKFYPFFSESTIFFNNLSDARMDRINRMVRLQRWLDLSYEETDLLLSACIRAQGTDNTDFSLNAHTLRALGVFRHWQQTYGVNAFEFAALLDQITPYAISPAVPFFDQVFNSPSLFDEPFAITGETVNYAAVTGDSARTVRQMCAGLDITQAQFRVLADKVAAEQGSKTDKTFPLTLPVVSAFYRLVMVPRWLGLSFADGAALLSLAGESDTAWAALAGVPQLAALTDGQPAGGDVLDLLMALDAAAEWAADHKLSWVKNWLTLQSGTAVPASTDLEFSNTSLVNGKFGQGIQTRTADNSYIYFHPYGKIAQAMKGDKSFTLGFWVNRLHYDTRRDPVASNSGDANVPSCSSGHSLSCYQGSDASDSDAVIAYLVDDNGNSVSSGWKGYILGLNSWHYIALTWDATNKQAVWYIYDGHDYNTFLLDGSRLNAITTAAGFTWAFNVCGDLKHHSEAKEDVPNFIYDDISVFDGVLTADDINALATSGTPIAETDISGFSANCIWKLVLQPDMDALVATAATVNFVNGIKQQLPAALLREESFAAVPLPAGSTASGWLSLFPDLIDGNGLVQVAATDDSTIAAMVEADITHAGITFASDADREQAISSLSGIINQARLTQNGIADSALAQLFSTSQSLSPFLLQWAGDSEYRLLSDSLTLNSGAALTDPSQVPAAYLTRLFALGQRAGISLAFSLTPATLSLFLAHPGWFGVSDTTLSLTLLYRFSRYGDWLKVPGDEDRVLAYLSWVNGVTAPDAAKAAEALALLLDWESSEVADATASLPGSLAKTVTDVDYVMRLQQLSAQTGLSVTPLLETGELAPGGVSDTWDAWQSAGESLVAAQSGQQ
ncbi:Tc toxin subunit A [Pseudescherichia sp.]|uniref:Tc toxin subunit A n=1 Tax=Pseudescherichia sp. TaxID=2055881 RepID=UPI0028B23CE7|nr:Tc toxin subunit A [Pseudescherichia sp.]